MKILYCFSTTESGEPEAVDQFIAGYESEGATWGGTMTVLENIDTEDIDTDFIQPYLNSGYEMLLRNTALNESFLQDYIYAKENGMLLVVPVGDNAFVDIRDTNYSYFGNNYSMITCGAGLNGTNQTSYPCFFFDADPSDILGGVPYQSYSVPYIAGKMCYIKEQRGGDWDDTIGACILTASESGTFDNINGYGIIDVTAAADILLDSDLATPVLTGTETSAGNYRLTWNEVPFAKEYEVYRQGVLLATITAQVTLYADNLSRQSKGKRNWYKVRAKNGDVYSEFSNSVEYKYYYNTGILQKVYV
jgi:hypothetical protein